MIVGENDWGGGYGGWNNKPHAPFSPDADHEKDGGALKT